MEVGDGAKEVGEKANDVGDRAKEVTNGANEIKDGAKEDYNIFYTVTFYGQFSNVKKLILLNYVWPMFLLSIFIR